MKDKIKEIKKILNTYGMTKSDLSEVVLKGNKFNEVAQEIVKLFAIPVVSNNEAYEFRGVTNNVFFSDEIEPPIYGLKKSEVAVCDELYHHKHVCLSSIKYRYCPHCGKPLSQTDC